MEKLIICFLVFIPLGIFCQDFTPIQTGPRIGADIRLEKSDRIVLSDALGQDSLMVSPQKSATHFMLGMFTQFNINEFFYVRPEFLVSLGNKSFDIEPIGGEKQERSYRQYGFVMPVHAGYRVEGFSLQFGFVYHSRLRNDIRDEVEDFEVKFDKSYVNMSFGLGWHNELFFIDIRFEPSFRGNEDYMANYGESRKFGTRTRHLTFSVGFSLTD